MEGFAAGEVEEPLALPLVHRERRFIHDRGVNVSLVEYLDTGTWYLAIYNDGIGVNEASKWVLVLYLEFRSGRFLYPYVKIYEVSEPACWSLIYRMLEW